MTKLFDLTKPVQTRDGRPARIICTDRKMKDYPIIALVQTRDSLSEQVLSCRADGTSGGFKEYDLVNIPEEKSGWVNIYKLWSDTAHITGKLWNTEKEALAARNGHTEYIGDPIEIKWKE